MMAVDEALAEAFKLHMNQRSQKKAKKGSWVLAKGGINQTWGRGGGQGGCAL